MSEELLEIFFFRINEYLSECPDDVMQVIWHGGEPLLLGKDFFEKAYELQGLICSQTAKRIRHAMQSNLTLYTSEFAGILKKLGMENIGTSYDPVHHVRGLGSRQDSDSYNRKFMEGIGRLDRNGFGWGVIYVVTKLSLDAPLDIFHFLANLCPQGSMMFNPVVLYNRDLKHLEITPQEYTEFLGEIFPVWWKNRDRYGQVEPFYSLKRNLVDKELTLSCNDSGSCAHSHINLAPDGRLSQCGRSSDYGILDYGSIADNPFLDVLHDPQRDELLERNLILMDNECKGCRFWSICHGGCPLDAWAHTGSFHHKTPWCASKKDFIENYFEPIVFGDKKGNHVVGFGGSRVPFGEGGKKSRPERARNSDRNEDPIWIDPVGGLGDTLMLSGVLKRAVEADPDRRFNLVTRTKYGPILKGHPAIAKIGYPSRDARLLRTNYWDHERFGQGQRAFQVLAVMLGLEPPVDESLYVPWQIEDDPVLTGIIPWKEKNLLICSSSDSPRKQMSINKWESVVDRLCSHGIGVVQVGKRADPYVRGAYSVLGLTNPRQIISLISRFDAVITSDNFIMHAAHLCGVPAIVLWGPTSNTIYGYQEQSHIQASPGCAFRDGCIGSGKGNIYVTRCPRDGDHCMDLIDEMKIHEAVHVILNIPKNGRGAPLSGFPDTSPKVFKSMKKPLPDKL